MWSPNGKVWSPEMKNVESKMSQSRNVMMMMGASLIHFGQKETSIQMPPPTFGPNVVLCSSSLIFSKIFSLARLHVIAEIRNPRGGHATGVLCITSV